MIEAYTDGSCYYKDRVGGWGATINIAGVVVEISGHKRNTTSNRMEVLAVIKALKLIKTSSDIVLYSDSMYVVNGIKKQGWQGRENLLNSDLWKTLIPLVYHHNITPVWVKGHSGVQGNERADYLAGLARKNLLNRLCNNG